MTTVAPDLDAASGFGDLLRHWRAVRRLSQLDLASGAETTPRYVSFVETGRSRPSREMVLRLARALNVPLRERNGMLLAAGYAPRYAMAPLGSRGLDRVETALVSMLGQPEPLPAVVMNRSWDVVRVNRGARELFDRLCDPEPVPDPANVLRMMIEPGPVRDSVRNWGNVVPALLERAGREAVGGVFDPDTARLVQRLRERPDVATLSGVDVSAQQPVPVLDVHFDVKGVVVEFFSVVSTIGTPVDVTAQELRVEAFFPSNEASRSAWDELVGRDQPASPAPRAPGPQLHCRLVVPRGTNATCVFPSSQSAPVGAPVPG